MKVLIAASQEPAEICKRILQGYETYIAGTLFEAKQLLETQRFDLIICTILFDESRMFDLLRLAKGNSQWRQIPFVCARVRALAMNNALAIEGVKIASLALGAQIFIDINDYPQEPEKYIRQEIDLILNGKRADA